MRTRVAGWAAASLLVFAASASADVEARAELGFGGRWIVDAATPLRVDLSNTGAEPVVVEIRVAQGEGIGLSDTVHRRVVQMAPGAARQEVFLVPGTRAWSGGVSVTLEVDPTVPIHTPVRSADRGSVTFDVSGEAAGYTGAQIPYATRVLGVVGDPRNAIVARLDRGEAPNDPVASKRLRAVGVPADLLRLAPLGLDGIDTLVLCDPDAQTVADPGTAQAIVDWVALGGTLAVSLGDHAAEFAASPLAAAMPATWTGSARTDYAGLIELLGPKRPDDAIAGPWIALRPNALAEKRSPGEHEGSPIRATRRLGMGRIVLLPFDLRLTVAYPPLEDADVEKVLSPIAPSAPQKADADLNQFVGEDFSNAIARTLQSGAFEAPPLPLVVLGILLYVVVVGPLDWFVLKKLRKERLTTLTFLGAVLTFTLLAYGASLLLFSSGARVNRIVIADLADADGGRQAMRYLDIAGFYSPTGSDQDVAYSGSAVVLTPNLPGSGMGGDVGSPMPVQVMSNDPLHPRALVQLAFRSQRVIRVGVASTLGPTLDVEWQDDGKSRGVRVTNGLPVDLDDVAVYTNDEVAYELGPIASGAKSQDGRFHAIPGKRGRVSSVPDWNQRWGNVAAADPAGVRQLLEAMTIGSWSNTAPGARPGGDAAAALRKSGVSRASAFARGHALLVAHASKFPGKLPGDATEGDTYVVLRKEIEIP